MVRFVFYAYNAIWPSFTAQPYPFFPFIINLMRYTEKVYSSSLFACASLRKILFCLEGQAAGLYCHLCLYIQFSPFVNLNDFIKILLLD